jgi:hypothetical protein
MKALFLIVIFILFFLKSSFAQGFADINADIPGLTNSQTLDWGDYDNDGDLDLIIAGQLEEGLACVAMIYRNDHGTFNKVDLPLSPLYYSFIRFIDYDSDGDLDFLYSGQLSYGSGPKTFICENSGGTFTEHDLNINKSGHIECGDYDNDGDCDFILTSNHGQGPYTCLFRNDASSFIQIATTFINLKFARAAFGDYDNDGDLDLVISGETDEIADYKLLIYRNDQHDQFMDINAGLDKIYGYVSWGDYDHDGDSDILISGYHNYIEPITKIYNNQGNDQFIESDITLPQIAGKSLFFDYDNDNDQDILIVGNKGIYPNTTTVIRILRNDDYVTFSEIDPHIYSQFGDFAIGDYNGDGDADFAISGPDSLTGPHYTSRIYSNTLINSIGNLQFPAIYSIYPNPTESSFEIKVDEKSSYRTDVSIYSIDYKLIRSSVYYHETEITIDISTYSNGLYFIRLANDKTNSMFKIIKQ